MAEMNYTLLTERGLLRLSGADARTFLQGLMSNDVEGVKADNSVYAALLTPQGKFLFEIRRASCRERV